DRLQQALATCVRNKQYGALLFIDLDNFKTLNDTHGHDKGDLLLQEVANRLVACVRECDTVARLGGDEFVVMLTGLNACPEEAAAQSQQIGMKILERLSQQYCLRAQEHHCSASIGINLFDGHSSSLNDSMKQADIALYQAKSAGRNTLRFFDPKMQSTILERAALTRDLRLALAKNQFKLFCQVEVGSDQRIFAVELLLRWQHAEHGLITPQEFIPLAEETGLIQPIGKWVLETACAWLKSRDESTGRGLLNVAVNISARQFHQSDFVNEVLEIVRNTGIDPGRLLLELTENVVLADINHTIAKMHELKAAGVRFSLDDFGTGYSSLAYLARLPFDQLKIDRSFVQNIGVKPSDAVIIKAIIVITNELGINVIAEGVETHAQRAFLEQHGCHVCQGYLFGKPVPLEAFELGTSSHSGIGVIGDTLSRMTE
ncbi:MAG: putative bifunctional diguanylate cyclase/phosphodiesterase, partial [Candidatus Methylumidiphilus sp.]